MTRAMGERMEITDDTRAFWYLELPGGNWTAMLTKAEGKVQLQFRFRWYKDAKVWDSEDVKNFYTATPNDDDIENVITKTRLILGTLKLKGAGRSWELLRGPAESPREFFERFLALPFVQARDLRGTNLKPGQEGAKEH